ncbi:MAG: LysM peptidoglycan-binding domain-containing protein [Phenylobacterium sp.]|nr:MAG: LysM peptidoglycan-binding domain-containing protein [Phenylobacterium sp.]
MTQTFGRTALLLLATSTLALSAGASSAAVHHRRHHHHAAPAAEADQPAAATYKVRKGDTLATIADTLNVTVAQLKKANHLKGTALTPGKILKIPGAAPAKGATGKKGSHAAQAAAEAPTTYKVRKGDTLDKVAKKTGVSVAELRAANGLTKRAKIHAGQSLKLSAEEAAPARRGRKGARGEAQTEEPVYTAGGDHGGRASIGRVVEVEGAPRTYRVKRGDTLEKVAEKLGLSVAQLKKENHLRRSTVKRGQVLRGRGELVKAYVVGPGDTIYSISRRFDVSVERLRAANGMGRRGSIHTGEKLRLPAGFRDHGAAAGTFTPPTYQAPPERPTTELPPTRPTYTPPSRPYVPPVIATPGSGPAVAPTSAPPPTDAQISEMGRGKFLWPLQGQIISDFGAKATGQRNDGINIQASTGDPVHAAASGSVVYAGDQVPGYGNLVLINHADGWVTAYAHLSKVEVKMQQKVSQGQEIGLAGSTGGVSAPQVHFEVRYHANPSDRAQPIDPKLVLPRN